LKTMAQREIITQMASNAKQPVGPLFLGIEGGGTRSVAVMADEQGKFVRRIEAGPGNVRLLDDAQLLELLEGVAAAFPMPDAVAIGMAGARTPADERRIREAAGRVWPGISCRTTNDLETALAAGKEAGDEKFAARVLVLSGTGSCCFGRNARGRTAKVGGWGHILGDGGSGHDIGLMALRNVVAHRDREGNWPALGGRILRRLGLKQPDELIGWAQTAGKAEMAGLAEKVFRAGERGDKMAALILKFAEMSLARDATACARKLAKKGTPVRFILAGGILLRQPRFAKQLGARLRKWSPGAKVTFLKREGAWGAVALAREMWCRHGKARTLPREVEVIATPRRAETRDVEWVKRALTEQRNPRSAHLDKMPVRKAIELMVSEDAKIPGAILEQRREIEKAVGLVTKAFKQGGRLIYVGAGTSGRLGVLDASECPPTFRTPPEMVQGIIAGGTPALSRSVEGAEDDAEAGARAVAARKVNRRDVVAGISASGRTPFVWGALDEAGRRGAKTVLLCFNPIQKITGRRRPALVIAPQVGAEVLTGSTRLKAGTATKLILNMLTTLAMARTGRVAGNLMVGLNPSNVKLLDRAVRIVRELCGVGDVEAREALERTGWVVQRACAEAGKACTH
jgi:N-acetylmuramic acid 6-phosphate etherase